jgi:hypothetical protein
VDTPDVADFDPNAIFNWDSAFAIDPETMTIGLPGVKDIWELPVSRVTKLNASRIRLALDAPLASQGVRPTVGSYWLLRHFGYEVHALWIESCTHCTVDGVTIFSSPGMAMTIGDDSQHIAIKNSRIGVFPGAARQMSSATDGIHFAGTRGDILVENVEISHHGDDCVNVNDPVSVGFRVVDRNTIVAYDWRNGRIKYGAGDTVGFREADYADTGIKVTVTSAAYESGGWRLRFRERLPTFRNLTTRMFVNNLSRYTARNVIIRGLHCHSNRARGVVLQGHNVVVEQSCFTNIQQEAIRVSSEIFLGRWAEGTGSVKTVLDSNTIVKVDKQDTGRGAIYSGASYSDGLGLSASVHSDMIIANSVINSTFTRALVMQMFDNVSIAGNTIVNADSESVNIGVVRVRKSTNVRINNNNWAYEKGVAERTAGAKVQIETSSTSNVYGNGNALLSVEELLQPTTTTTTKTVRSTTKAIATSAEEASATVSLLPAEEAPLAPEATETAEAGEDEGPIFDPEPTEEPALFDPVPSGTLEISRPITETDAPGFLDNGPLAEIATKIVVATNTPIASDEKAKIPNLVGA